MPERANDPLTAIRAEEQRIAVRVTLVRADAEARLVQARARARAIEDQARAIAQEEAAAALTAVRIEMAEQTALVVGEADQEAAQIRERAAAQQTTAVRAILDYVLPDHTLADGP